MKPTLKQPRPNVSRRTRRWKRIVAEWLCGLLFFTYFLFYWENNTIDVTSFEEKDTHIPSALHELTIVHLSDLHGKSFGRNNIRLLRKIRKQGPDVIAVTGDLIDERNPDLDYVRETIQGLAGVAPVFYVTGNHEGQFVDSLRDKFLEAVKTSGAYVLDNAQVELTRGENGGLVITPFERDPERTPTSNSILLAGICDPRATYTSEIPLVEQYRKDADIVEDLLAKVPNKPEQYSVLLSHRPEYIEKYAEHKLDLVLAGHSHGGQFRIPYLLPNGLFAPDQGFWPRYTGGRHVIDGTTEIVSRGLGPSVIPTRIFNHPNLVVCTLRTQEE
jgi:predicted MPP superfamily phosphohydrolase